MNFQYLESFRKILIENNVKISEIEYTENNFDDDGNLIEEKLPTITTNFCEIGLFKKEIYFVFIIKTETFSLSFFNELKKKENLLIYGFKDFNKTLYPIKNFDLNVFITEIKKDNYLQIQFNYEDVSLENLFENYLNIVRILKRNKIKIVDQLKS